MVESQLKALDIVDAQDVEGATGEHTRIGASDQVVLVIFVLSNILDQQNMINHRVFIPTPRVHLPLQLPSLGRRKRLIRPLLRIDSREDCVAVARLDERRYPVLDDLD